MALRSVARRSARVPHDPVLARDWNLFIALTFLFSFGFGIYAGVFQNFLRDILHSDALGLGRLESTREIPGLLAAITAGSLVALAEARIAGLGLAITAVGIGLTGIAAQHGYGMVVAITVFWSIGFHLYAAVSPAITLALAKGREGGRHLGRMSAVGSWATLGALGVAWVMSQRLPPGQYNLYFFIAGISILAGAILCTRLSTHAAGAPRAPIILRRHYALYYILTFLEGCRRQIFSIFASFALILVYHVAVPDMLMLQLVNAVLISITAPAIGRMVDQHGERKPLTFYSIGLIVVFLGYATFENKYALYGLFLIDNVLFSFGVGFNTYLNRIVKPGELTPCISMGVTMNHIAAVTVPIGGAWLWEHYHNYQLPFWVGVGIATISLSATRWLPVGAIPEGHAVPPMAPPQEEASAMAAVESALAE